LTVLVPITLFGWVIFAVSLFAMLPPRRAVLAAYILAWLFLPQAGMPVTGLPDLDKVTAAGAGVMLGVLLFDAGRLSTFRLSAVDLPMIAWCMSSLPSALTNDLGWYDGLSGVLRDLFTWGIPYFVGRLYFSDLQSLRELAIGIFLGGMLYVPLCLLEIRLSPQLHRWVYGFHPAHFAMAIRFGGYRPMVFMQHGLMVGMWMTSATLCGVWLWRTGALSKVRGAPMFMLVALLGATTVLCRSMGALALLLFGLGLLFVNRHVRSGALMALVLLLPPAYMLVRSQGWWDGHQLLELSARIDEERADSLRGRLLDENMLIERASEKPIFGWGGWGRWRVRNDETGEDMTSSDGMWVIVRGERGMVGLAAITLAVLLPFVLLMRRVPARDWAHPVFAGPAALAMLLLLWSIDNLFNAMHNPVYIMAAGGLSGLYLMYPHLLARQRAMWQQHSMAMQAAAVRQARAVASAAGGAVSGLAQR
jgi:hypothetical protein